MTRIAKARELNLPGQRVRYSRSKHIRQLSAAFATYPAADLL
jgi:hypothetical protein